MTPERAQTLISVAVSERRKWGKNFTTADMDEHELLDALVALEDAEQAASATTNRQLGAAKARETKLRKDLANANSRIKQLESDFVGLNKQLEYLSRNTEKVQASRVATP